MKLTLILLVVVACSWSYEAQSGANYYCGRRLSQVMAAICWGSEEKRAASSWGPEDKRAAGSWGPEEKRATGWWWREDEARALGGVRGKRGLADECCDKPCTMEEMLSYC